MKDEIIEILGYFRKYMNIDDCIRLSKIEYYITNLQDKEKLEKIFKKYYEDEIEKTNKLQDRNIELVLERDKYKSRNEKAIEYINTHYLNANEPELLNILNDGDDNE